MPTQEEGWISQSEAARRLAAAGDSVTQQQLSRYLDRYPEIPRRDQGRRQPMLVDFDALARHRAENIHVVEAKQAADAEPETDAAADLRLRERAANAERAEFELAKAKGAYVTRETVLRGVQAAGAALRQALQRTRFERAEHLASARDARAIGLLLEAHDRALQHALSAGLKALAAAADAPETAPAPRDDEEETDAEPETPPPAAFETPLTA